MSRLFDGRRDVEGSPVTPMTQEELELQIDADIRKASNRFSEDETLNATIALGVAVQWLRDCGLSKMAVLQHAEFYVDALTAYRELEVAADA